MACLGARHPTLLVEAIVIGCLISCGGRLLAIQLPIQVPCLHLLLDKTLRLLASGGDGRQL